VWDFQTAEREAKHIANFITAEIKKYGLTPRDFAVLVRVKAAEYFKVLEPAFATAGLTLRNESALVGKVALQELFAEPLSEIIITLLRLLTSERAGHCWTECVDTLCTLRGLAFDDDGQRQKLAKTLETFAERFGKSFPRPPANGAEATAIFEKILEFAGVSDLRATSVAYRQGDWFDEVKQAVVTHLFNSSTGAVSWQSSLDVYEGVHAVPLMTIHKSKGLEYHTVIFVGLDDGAWFAFKQQSHEETAGLFVAFTRAKQRVIFTYCGARGTRMQIAPLYMLLQRAGVKTISKTI
jgi:superfamily I DNA/RNA helicase